MGGKHAKKDPKYKIKRQGSKYVVVISKSDTRVPGTPTYESELDAKAHADRLNG
jgi:hypothetical protein